MLIWKIGSFEELEKAEFYSALKLRCDVFIVEQGRAVGEIDGRDTHSGVIHILATDAHGRVVGYARICPPGLTYPEVSIQRVVIAKSNRGSGLGRDLVAKVCDTIRTRHGGQKVKIHAQSYLEKFYCSYGFHRIGDVFDEGGIEHVFLLSNPGF